METKVLVILCLAGLWAFSVASDGDSNGSDSGSESLGSWGDSFEAKDEDCDRLVEGSDDNDGGCDLTDGLEQVPDEIECTPEDKTIIINWITILKAKLAIKGFSVFERLTFAVSSIQKFQMEYPAVYEMIQYQNISGWGMLASLPKVLGYRQKEQCEGLITLDEDDNCPLFDALWNCTDGSEAQESAVNAFINETLMDICGNSSLSVKEKYVLIFKAMGSFFSINAQWQFTFFQYHIPGFGSIQQFYEVTKTVYQVSQIDVIFAGPPAECQFMVSFEQSLTLIFQDASVPSTIKGILKNFYDRCLQQISVEGASGKALLSIIIKEFQSFSTIYGVKITKFFMDMYCVDFGSFWDLINCGPWKIPLPLPGTPAPMPGSSSSPKPTCACTCQPLLSTMMP